MRHLTWFAMCVLSVCAVAAAERESATLPKPPEPEPEVRSFELTPVAPPTPALKYTLLVPYADRIPGNAALAYMDAAMLLGADSNDKSNQAVDAYDARDMKTFASIVDSINLPAMLSELDVAARREYCEWDPPLRDRGVLTLLPHLQPLTHGAATVVRVRAMRQIEQGKIDEALTTLRLGYEMSQKIGQEPVLVSSMVSVGQFGLMSEPLTMLMSHPNSPNLYWALVQMPARIETVRRGWDYEAGWPYVWQPTLGRARRGETLSAAEWRKAMYDEVAPIYAVYEDFAPVGTRAHPDPIKDASEEMLRTARADYATRQKISAEQSAKVDPAVVLGSYYFHQFQIAHDDITKLSGLAYPHLLPRARQAEARVAELKKSQPANPFFEVLEGIHRVAERFARGDRQLAAMTAVEAIRSYAAANNGKLPARLDDVTETPVPANPVTGKPFQYTVENGVATLTDAAEKGPLTYTITIRKK